MAKRIITISREFGSGGRFIGEEVAKKLEITYYDKNIISEIAEKSGLSPEYIQESAELSPKKGLFAVLFFPVLLVCPDNFGHLFCERFRSFSYLQSVCKNCFWAS